MKYCVYLTIYKGNQMPMFYIGSSTTKRIENGYHGSVLSSKYKKVWNEELTKSPNLFSTKILSTYKTQDEAVKTEARLQKKLKVVKSDMYINMAIARENGFFGRDVSGSNNPMFGRKGKNNPNYGSKRSEETKRLMSATNSHPMSEAQKEKLRKANLGKKYSDETKKKISDAHRGKIISEEEIQKRKATIAKQLKEGTHFNQKLFTCPHCNKTGRGPNMKRYHFDKCKFKRMSFP